jgi:hypothetical protein
MNLKLRQTSGDGRSHGGGPARYGCRVQQQPAPGQWSPDRLWWWDGQKWVPAPQAPPPPPPTYAPQLPPPHAYWPQQPQPASLPLPPPPAYWQQSAPTDFLAPAPGLRIFLLVFLVLTAVVSGLFMSAGALAISSGSTDSGSLIFLSIFVVLFGLSLAATIGVARRSPWSRVVAILAGVAVSLTCLGMVLGIPILVAAIRAPGLSRRSAPPPGYPMQTP